MHEYFRKVKIVFLLTLLFVVSTSSFSEFENDHMPFVSEEPGLKESLYGKLQLSQVGLKKDVFDKAITGWNILFEKQHLEKAHLLSIADLSQSSNSKRLYVIDMVEEKLLFNTYVAHGRNSGEEFAHSFSNKPNSNKSSLGFYVTESIYQGAHGLSMRLKGIETGINDNAEQRGIIVHGARYVHESFIKQTGRLGRSKGCPAIPQELCKPIVNTIKGGSCFFIFYPDSTYLKKSALL